MIRLLAFLAALCLAIPAHAAITADQVAIVINPDDASSVAVGKYYQQRRGIRMVIYAKVAFSGSRITPDAFAAWDAQVKAALVGHQEIKALVLTSRWPNRIYCNSATSAFAMGYIGDRQCSNLYPIDPTYSWGQMINPYFGSTAETPISVSTHNGTGRLVMSVAAVDIPTSVALIDRGIASDGAMVGRTGTAHIIWHDNNIGTIQKRVYTSAGYPMQIGPIKVQFDKGTLINQPDVIAQLESHDGLKGIFGVGNAYLPGAVFGNLDSFCGVQGAGIECEDSIKAGATCTTGTVAEPYAYPDKFIELYALLRSMTTGHTCIEYMSASVHWLINNNLIGEALACPFCLVKGNDFPAAVPPNDPCLAYVNKIVKQPTTEPIGARVPWNATDAAGNIIAQGKTTVPTSQILSVTVKGTAFVEGPVMFNGALRICSAVFL